MSFTSLWSHFRTNVAELPSHFEERIAPRIRQRDCLRLDKPPGGLPVLYLALVAFSDECCRIAIPFRGAHCTENSAKGLPAFGQTSRLFRCPLPRSGRIFGRMLPNCHPISRCALHREFGKGTACVWTNLQAVY